MKLTKKLIQTLNQERKLGVVEGVKYQVNVISEFGVETFEYDTYGMALAKYLSTPTAFATATKPTKVFG